MRSRSSSGSGSRRGYNRHLREDDDDRARPSRSVEEQPNGGNKQNGQPYRQPVRSPPIRKERSLSPYSKRIALTQAMNMRV